MPSAHTYCESSTLPAPLGGTGTGGRSDILSCIIYRKFPQTDIESVGICHLSAPNKKSATLSAPFAISVMMPGTGLVIISLSGACVTLSVALSVALSVTLSVRGDVALVLSVDISPPVQEQKARIQTAQRADNTYLFIA